jgi:hypothetical protein
MLLHINSRFRDSGTYDHFVVTVSEQVQYSTVKLMEVTIPQSFYTFNTSNNTITYFETGTPTTAVIPPGNYTASALATEIAAIMTAASQNSTTYTVVYNTNQNTYTISGSANFKLLFSYTNSPWYRLGFNNADTASGSSFSSPNSVDLAPDTYVYLQIEGLGVPKLQSARNQQIPAHFAISLNGNSYTVSSLTLNSDYTIKLMSTYNTAGQISVSLLNELGMPIGMRGDWGFTLSLSSGSGCGCS